MRAHGRWSATSWARDTADGFLCGITVCEESGEYYWSILKCSGPNVEVDESGFSPSFDAAKKCVNRELRRQRRVAKVGHGTR